MAEEISQEQLWKLYEKLPPELKEAIFSEETANNIFDICIRNGIDDEKISEVARYTGRVLMGLLPSEEFQRNLEKKLYLDGELAKRISHEIYRFVFAPVKDNLAELYGKEIVRPEKVTVPREERISEETSLPEAEKEKKEIYRWLESERKEPPSPSEKDIYREPIE